jgi:hypothetical protein
VFHEAVAKAAHLLAEFNAPLRSHIINQKYKAAAGVRGNSDLPEAPLLDSAREVEDRNGTRVVVRLTEEFRRDGPLAAAAPSLQA